VIKKVNATEISNAGAIIATLKRQLIVQKRCNVMCRLLKIGPPVLCTSHRFTQPPNPMLCNSLQLARHSQKCSLLWGHLQPMWYMFPGSTLHLSRFSHFVFAQLMADAW